MITWKQVLKAHVKVDCYQEEFPLAYELKGANVSDADWVHDIRTQRATYKSDVLKFSDFVVKSIEYAEFVVFPHFPLAYLI